MNERQKILKLITGFTLVELLVVIAIIAILAAITVPVVARSKIKAKTATAKIQMSELNAAIVSYKNDYERFPIPADYDENDWGDVTFNSDLGWVKGGNGQWIDKGKNHNKFFIDILINPQNSRNPKKHKYLTLKKTTGMKSDRRAGLSQDGYYLDPFGNEYFITVDRDRDGLCFDASYGKSNGLEYGLKSSQESKSTKKMGAANSGEIMIWTYGPDRKTTEDKRSEHYAPMDVNGTESSRDNIISWD